MKNKSQDSFDSQYFNDLKLTAEELGRIPEFENLTVTEREAIADFVYALSVIAYKIYVRKYAELY